MFTKLVHQWIDENRNNDELSLSSRMHVSALFDFAEWLDTRNLTTDEAADSIQTEPCKHIWVWSKNDKLKFKFCYKCGVRFSADPWKHPIANPKP